MTKTISRTRIFGASSKAREEEKERELLRLAERKTLLKQEESKLLIETNEKTVIVADD